MAKNATSITEALLEFFERNLTSELRTRADYLGFEMGDASLETTPGDTLVEPYVDGSAMRQHQFLFAARLDYGAEATTNLCNTLLLEQIADKIARLSHNNILPRLPKGMTAISLEVLSSGYVIDDDACGGSARYQYQCKLTYIERCQK